MNQAQVTKVVHAAHRAVDETLGLPSGKSYEQLSDADRSALDKDTGDLKTAASRSTNIDDVVSELPNDKKLKAYISHGIVQAFQKYDDAIANGNDLAAHPHDGSVSVDREVAHDRAARERILTGDKPAAAGSIGEATERVNAGKGGAPEATASEEEPVSD
jgi:hypothetical protein